MTSGLVSGRVRAGYLELLWAVVSRDIRGKYRRSSLGLLWAVIQPLYMMLLFNFLHLLVHIPSEGVAYPLFSYSALVPWSFFSSAALGCTSLIMSNRDLFKKIAVPMEVFPVAALVEAGFEMLASGVVLAGLMVWFGAPWGWHLWWLVPLVLVTAGLGLGVGMLISAFGVFRNDFQRLGGFALQVMMYLSPIIYPLSSVPERWRHLYLLNPMVGLLTGFREVLAKGRAPEMELLLWALPGLVLVWVLAWPVYRYASRYFADVL